MKIHVLAGDSLSKPFADSGIEGEVYVCRECFVDGDLEADNLTDFWTLREKYLSANYGAPDPDYKSKVVDEFVRLWNSGDGNEVVLWFEYELFCQVNLWFTVWLLRNTEARFSIAYPKLIDGDSMWKGFGSLTGDELHESFRSRIKMSHDDEFLAIDLWESFQKRDFDKLMALSVRETRAFPTLKPVIEAACEIESRPKAALRRIIDSGKNGFADAFQEFCKTEAVYGFGDLQARRIFDEIMNVD